MGQVLSRSEVESILSALDFGEKHLSPANQSVSNNSVTLYDFEHPIRLQESQLYNLELASAKLIPRLQTRLSNVLHASASVSLLGVEQSTFHDFLATTEKPACLAVLQQPVEAGERWFLDISRTLAMTLIDCQLGGNPSLNKPMTTLLRPLTELEGRLVDKAIRAILPEITTVFSNPISLRMTQFVSDPACMHESTSNEAVALVSFEVSVGPHQGLMQICVPWKYAVEQINSVWTETGELHSRMRSGAIKIPLTAVAQMARLRLSARELANLSVGDILLTETSPTSEMRLEVDGRELFRGTPGQIHDRRVIRLTSTVRAP